MFSIRTIALAAVVDHDGSKLLLGNDASTKKIHTAIHRLNCKIVSFDAVLNLSDIKNIVQIASPSSANIALITGIIFDPQTIC